jgi:hypothetical protein
MARFNLHTTLSAQTVWCKSSLNLEVMQSLRRPLTQTVSAKQVPWVSRSGDRV